MAAEVMFLVLIASILTYAEVPLKKEYIQASTLETRKGRSANDLTFETSHKIPPSLTYLLSENNESGHIRDKRLAPAPVPMGSIKLDAKQLIDKYRKERLLPEDDKEPRSRRDTVTSPKPILTSETPYTQTGAEPNRNKGSSSDNKRSRIQIKKGPNGQDYEYEYLYYYDDDIDDKTSTKKVLNSHDGPAFDEKPSKSNEVIPSNNSIARQLIDEDTIGDERLPTNTRFPPRSSTSNVTSTLTSHEETSKLVERTSTTGVQTEESNQVSRGRTRSNIYRPSLELVDSLNTQPNGGGPSFPTDLPSGPVRFLGATPNERPEQPFEEKFRSASVDVQSAPASSKDAASSKESNPMDKVALDLYAILQTSQKLGETDIADNSTIPDHEGATNYTVESAVLSTTSTTTTTTTTTTTPPTTTTTTTTPEPSTTGRGRFRGRTNTKKYGSSTASPSTTEPPSDPKTKGRFGRPSFGNKPKPTTRTSPESNEVDSAKEDVKPKPTSRTRFGSGRTKPSTESHEESSSSTTVKSTSQRARPAFNTRGRGRNTSPTPTDSEAASAHDVNSTTIKPRVAPGGNSAVKPLRPGPRINLARGRPGATSSTSAPETPGEETLHEETSIAHESKEQEVSAHAADDKNPLNKLRNRPKPSLPNTQTKFTGNTPVQIKRVNPLLNRRRPGTAVEQTSTTETPIEPQSNSDEEHDDVSEQSESQSSSSTTTTTTTTEEPRGLNKLLAGRRQVRNRQPGTIINNNSN